MEPLAPESDVQSLSDILKILSRRKWSLIITALLLFFAAAAVALFLPPVYRSISTILIEEQEIPAEFVMATVTSFAEERIQVIKQRVMSFTTLSELIDRFNLYADLKKSQTKEQLVEKMRDDIQVKPISAEVRNPRSGGQMSATIAFTISYDGKHPDTVLQVTNTLTSLFLSENYKVRERQTAETTQFLESEMNRLKAELAACDTKIAAFKEAHTHELPELFQVNVQAKEQTERDIERLNDQIRTLRERESFLQSQLSALPVTVISGTDDRSRLEELRILLVNLKSKFTDEHPDVIRTRKEIADLEKHLAEGKPAGKGSSAASPVTRTSNNPALVTLNSQLAATTLEIESLNRQIEAVRKKAEQYNRRIEASPHVEKAYNEMLLEKNSTQAKYKDLTAKYMESQVAHGLEKEQKGERFAILDPPRLPVKPVKPNRLAVLLIGFVLAVGGGAGVATFREFLDDSIRDYRRLSRSTPYPVLAGIPRIETRGDIVRRRWKRAAFSVGVLGVIAGGLYAFNNLVMPLDILWIKISSRMNLPV
jgi:succinoglycan biosynthesis transport protein ExoP